MILPRSRVIAKFLMALLSVCAASVCVAAHSGGNFPTSEHKSLVNAFAIICATLAGIVGTPLYFSCLVRSKNTLSAIGQIFACTSIAVLVWVIQDAVVNADKGFALAKAGAEFSADTIARLFGILIITTPLIVGAVVERVRISAIAVIAIVWSAIVFFPLATFVWHTHATKGVQLIDWAGSSAHLAAGAFSMGLCLATGNRHGYGRIPMPPYHLGFALIGACMMFVGWAGFNEWGIVGDNPRFPGAGIINSFAAAAAGLSAWCVLEVFSRKTASTLGMASGGLVGIVCVAAVAGFASPAQSVLLGAIGGVVGFTGAVWMRRVFHYDDSLDVFALHAMPAVVGLIAAPIIAPTPKVELITQIGIVLAIGVATFLAGYACASALRGLKVLRVSFDDEDAGLDLTTHGETVHPPQSTL